MASIATEPSASSGKLRIVTIALSAPRAAARLTPNGHTERITLAAATDQAAANAVRSAKNHLYPE